MTEQELGTLLKARGWLSPGEKETVAKAWELFSKYALEFVFMHKLRSGELGLSPEEEWLQPLILEAKKLLDIKD